MPLKNSPSLPFSPLAGEMPKACPGLDPGAEGGPLFGRPIWLLAPPLCHSVTSPPARGGDGIRELFKGLPERVPARGQGREAELCVSLLAGGAPGELL